MAGKESKSPDDGWEGIAFFFAVDGEDFGGEGGGRRRTKEESRGFIIYLFIYLLLFNIRTVCLSQAFFIVINTLPYFHNVGIELWMNFYTN